LLLRGLLDQASERFPDEFCQAGVEESFELLTRVQKRSPEVINELLLHPHVGGWIAFCLRRLGETARPEEQSRPLEFDLAHLGAIAVSAAIVGGEPCAVRVPVLDGNLVLPLCGSTRIRTVSPLALADVRWTEHALIIDCHGSEATLSGDFTNDHG